MSKKSGCGNGLMTFVLSLVLFLALFAGRGMAACAATEYEIDLTGSGPVTVPFSLSLVYGDYHGQNGMLSFTGDESDETRERRLIDFNGDGVYDASFVTSDNGSTTSTTITRLAGADSLTQDYTYSVPSGGYMSDQYSSIVFKVKAPAVRCTVIWLNGDGSVLYSATCNKGEEEPALPEDMVPVKAEDDDNTYTFANEWTSSLELDDTVKTYTPVFTAVAKTIPVTAVTIDTVNDTDINTLTLYPGMKLKLTASVTPEDATDKTISWTCTSSGQRSTTNSATYSYVAESLDLSVDTDGILSVKPTEGEKWDAFSDIGGTYTFTASADEKSAACQVTVSMPKMTTVGGVVTITPSTLSLKEGESAGITASLVSEDVIKNPVWSWSNSNTNIAEISSITDNSMAAVLAGARNPSDGGSSTKESVAVIKAVHPGTVTIKVSVTDSASGDGKKVQSDSYYVYCEVIVTAADPASDPAPEPNPDHDLAPDSTPEPTPPPSPSIEEPITLPKAPSGVKAKGKKAKIIVTWNKIKKTKKTKALRAMIQGIQVQAATDPDFKNIVKTVNITKNKTKVKLKLQGKTSYYVRVRYVADDGVSSWSKVKKAKAK